MSQLFAQNGHKNAELTWPLGGLATAAAVELLHSTQCSCTVELLHSARCKLRGSGVAHGSPVLPGLLPGTEAPPDLSSLHAHAQPPSTAHCPDRCSPGYSTRPVAPTMASLQAHPTPPHNLSLHALRCHISSAVRTSGGSSQVFLPTRLRLEFPRETGLILRCAMKVGNPF